ncbi:tetratricopeptide repeat protein [Flavobacterium sp. SUN046]|uniref:tetratricopeptide repeat protein n=1 Tax=Flavobacterium sp. SUN046 TaxID=3002440 RepID=UPI002DB9B1AC|nr:tetratricopeptide repeat protein [Flavobacterium sp. SUN046]MEC4049607.1 tetratricopeptide repeat protein [Flavobacterium sp. SUN046]
MNQTDFTHLVNKPDTINERQNDSLEKIIEEFPYFQSARVLRLKHLYNQDSFKYNYALKVAAAFTTDRSILFDFITSDNFVTIQNRLYDQKIAELLDIDVVGMEVVTYDKDSAINPLEQSILSSINEAEVAKELVEEKLNIGKPLEFSQNEKHSFQEWLQLSRLSPIERKPQPIAENNPIEEEEKRKKLELIDKFIENNPKIPPVKKEISTMAIETKIEDKSYLMTETLARVYLEQRKYSKAIQAYEILILKYPEKSSFFADRILDIKNLQQNNN